jgi:hypothetical protein
MQYQKTPKTVEEYLTSFPIQMEEVDTVIGRPKVMVALKTNCIAMEDTRSNLGKLHCIMNTAHLETTKLIVPPSTDPGQIAFDALDLTDTTFPDARDAHMIVYTQQKYLWDSDRNLKEAAKRLVLSLFEPVYFQSLSHGLTKFKIVTIEQIIAYIHLNYPAEPEEIDLQEATLRSEWDPTNHIENLFQSVKEGVETLHAMEAVAKKDISKTCVKYVYSAIRGSGQFEAACIKWKALPAKERATMIQIRTFFRKKYDVYDVQTNSLHSAGVANSVQLQELREVTTDGLISVRDQLEEQDLNFVGHSI